MQASLDSVTALVRDEQSGQWLLFTNATEIVSTSDIEEVAGCFQRLQALIDDGYYAVGYVAYEAAPAFDSSLPAHQPGTPLLCFAIFEEPAVASLPQPLPDLPLSLATSLERGDYLEKIEKIKDHLEAGDCYQVNFTHTLRGQRVSDASSPLDIFATLYEHQPSPRSVFFQHDSTIICSVSPELFFKLEGDRITMEPMKGTRPRHEVRELDEQLQQELLDSEKEKAENLMIVDMVRNDLGKIARPGSVQVDALFEIMALPTLWQQVSRVSASSGASLWQIFRALFPCASITGAPKRQSMEIIRTLETSARGIYTGAIGVISPQRRAQFNVGIRTLVLNDHNMTASYGVGSGVVWDSDPASEWQETLDKARIVQPRQSFDLLETMLYRPGEGIVLHKFHLQRLSDSANYFGYPLNPDEIGRVLATIESSEPLRIRLLLDSAGQCRVETSPLVRAAEEVTLTLAKKPVQSGDLFLRHKTTNREVYESARADAGEVDDVVLWNERGELTETTIYNLFLEIDGELLTPALSSGLLAGTLRRDLLESGKAREAVLNLGDLERATRVFVGNSVRGLLPARPIPQAIDLMSHIGVKAE
ncbi:MAG: chorismate-binding protein [Proteobacteria bacterium]|nr:chorismate-binding protein [Pseudomonadota bacterium]MDA0928594.1 chorismate-binding protein [Pseudomonadota bacterium]